MTQYVYLLFLTSLTSALLRLILSDLLTYVLIVGLVPVLTFNLCPTYPPTLVGLVPFFRRPGDPKITSIFKPVTGNINYLILVAD